MIFVTFILAACFSPWQGEEGNLTISLGGNARSATWPPTNENGILPALEHRITLRGPGETQNRTLLPGISTGKFNVNSGLWTVTIEAWYEGNLFGMGFSSVNIKPGQNVAVTIKMNPPQISIEQELFLPGRYLLRKDGVFVLEGFILPEDVLEVKEIHLDTLELVGGGGGGGGGYQTIFGPSYGGGGGGSTQFRINNNQVYFVGGGGGGSTGSIWSSNFGSGGGGGAGAKLTLTNVILENAAAPSIIIGSGGSGGVYDLSGTGGFPDGENGYQSTSVGGLTFSSNGGSGGNGGQSPGTASGFPGQGNALSGGGGNNGSSGFAAGFNGGNTGWDGGGSGGGSGGGFSSAGSGNNGGSGLGFNNGENGGGSNSGRGGSGPGGGGGGSGDVGANGGNGGNGYARIVATVYF